MPSSYGFGEAFGSSYYMPAQDVYVRRITGPSSYVLSGYNVAADANGDKIIFAGTVLATSTQDPAAATPYDGNSGTTVIGVLVGADHNLRDGMRLAAVQRTPAVLNEAKCRDNGVYGTVRAGSKSALAAMGIYFTKVDS